MPVPVTTMPLTPLSRIFMGDRFIPAPSFDAAAESDWMGSRALEVMLADLKFPMRASELLERAGAWRVPVKGSHLTVPLREILSGVEPRHRFRSAASVARHVRSRFPEF